MISRSISHYVWFGTCVRYLQDAEAGWQLGKPDEDEMILFNIKGFLKYLEDLNLQVTRRASWKLKIFYEELLPFGADHRLTEEEAKKLVNLVSDIRKTLFAEMPGFRAYIVTPKRLDVQRLLSDVSSLLTLKSFAKLSKLTKYDLEEAGKCIAFERSTAAAFHLLRGTEGVLREFYCELVKRERVDLMWGNMLIDLRKRAKAKTYSDLINHLDHIRQSFRNPTQHPEKIYDIDEVQDLWSLCTDVISRMAKALPEKPGG